MTREQFIVLGVIVAAFLAGWLTSVLSSAAARRRGRGELEGATAAAGAGTNGHPPTLADAVGDALLNDAANERMVSALPADPTPSERELDLTDWGFSYGVAWARAREREDGQRHDHGHDLGRRPSDEELAAEALEAAEAMFRLYTSGAWKPSAGGQAPNGGQTAHSPSPRSTL